MSNIGLKDILISARQESHRMRHFYLGVEHLFIGLMDIKGGLTASILETKGLAPEYVTDAIRRKAGKGSRHRLWAGIPNTPRTEVVLDIAQEIALAENREEIQERDLLLAILDERDSIPTRVLPALGVTIDDFVQLARSHTLHRPTEQAFVKIDFGPAFEGELTKDQLFILRRMFHGYGLLRIEQRLNGGYTRTHLLVVTPVNLDQREDAPVVVKIGPTDVILDEAQRYDKYVRGTLPPMTARLEERPTAPETSDHAGIRYTLVTGSDGQPRDLREMIGTWSGEQLGRWLMEHLYATFGDGWWKQSRPYRFEVWREYDWVLPPVLTLEYSEQDQLPANTQMLKFPIKRRKLAKLEYGDSVMIENFIVQKVDHENNAIRLAVGHAADLMRAYQIEVRGIDFEQDTYYRGEIVERIGGRIWKTRGEQLTHAVRALEPDFEIDDELIRVDDHKLRNPLMAYNDVLDSYMEGNLSTIHGDLHLGNILIGPNEAALLIDFALTRDGHTVMDWATLEVSLLAEIVRPTLEPGWDAARYLLHVLHDMHDTKEGRLPEDQPELVDALLPIQAVRQIAANCLGRPNEWDEYFGSLALCSLRAVTWETMDSEARRLLFLVAAYAMTRFLDKSHEHQRPQSPDATDYITNA